MEQERSGRKWAWSGLLLALLIIPAALLAKGCGNGSKTSSPSGTASKAVDFEKFCVGALSFFEPYPLWIEGFLKTRVGCYELTDHAFLSRALRDLNDFESRAAPSANSLLEELILDTGEGG